jgi:hypothetical protein
MILIKYGQSNFHSTISTKSSVVAFHNVSPHNKAHSKELTHFDTHAIGMWKLVYLGIPGLTKSLKLSLYYLLDLLRN